MPKRPLSLAVLGQWDVLVDDRCEVVDPVPAA